MWLPRAPQSFSPGLPRASPHELLHELPQSFSELPQSFPELPQSFSELPRASLHELLFMSFSS